MKHIIILLVLVGSPLVEVNAQYKTFFSSDGFAIVIFKYNHRVNIWGRVSKSAEYEVAIDGAMYRSFPTGPKVLYGDERIPNGIFQAQIIERDGEVRIVIRLEVYPGWWEDYRLSGPSIDRNVIPLHSGIYEEAVAAAAAMRRSGYRTIPVVIMPGTLEKEIAEKLKSAKSVKPWQNLVAVASECQRWKDVEDYIIRTGRLPDLRFEDGEIIILEQERSDSLARRGEFQHQ